jgi:hypothetical protein
MSDVATHDTSPAMTGGAAHAFRRSHSIQIAAPPSAVFDYVTNPKSWPQWLLSSHHIDCDDRPMRFGDTFHEHWSTRSGPVNLDWLVIACEPPRLWIGLTQTPFMGPIVVQYDCVEKDEGCLFTRTLWNPAGRKYRRPRWCKGWMRKRRWGWGISSDRPKARPDVAPTKKSEDDHPRSRSVA